MEQHQNSSSAVAATAGVQNVVVMRHGDRIDAAEPLWVVQAERPWDPPLTEAGKIRAWTTGKRIRGLRFPIHRVIVSPFLRCLQTAAEVVAALCAVANDEELMLSMDTSKDAVIDPSRVKDLVDIHKGNILKLCPLEVHIELGLCEVMGSHAMRISEPAKDEIWFPAISELESIFPAGTLDSSAERIYQQLPQWEEPVSSARDRYKNIIQALADKFSNENLLLVTHGEAVGVSVNSFAKGLEVFEVEYCALSFLQRSSQAENLRVLTESAQSGVSYYSEADKTP